MLRNPIPKTAALAVALSLISAPIRADDTPEFMFVQTSATIVVASDAKTLRMVNVSPQTLYFSDRPDRLAGHITMNAYLEEWTSVADDFSDDPPNAVLSVYEPDQTESSLVVVEILDRVMDGDDLNYIYRLIDRIGSGGGVATRNCADGNC